MKIHLRKSPRKIKTKTQPLDLIVYIPVTNPNLPNYELEEQTRRLLPGEIKRKFESQKDTTIYISPKYEVRCTGIKLDDDGNRSYKMQVEGDLEIVIRDNPDKAMLRIPTNVNKPIPENLSKEPLKPVNSPTHWYSILKPKQER